jgi:hypothetical protein
MNKTIAAVVVAATLFATGCATQYASSDTSVTGGYTEVRLAPNQWRVLVEGNGFATRGEVEQFLMRRAAELTLEQGRRWFVLERHDAWMRHEWTDSGDVASPVNAAVVTAVDARSERAFDAVEIVHDTDRVAEGRLSASARAALRRFENS